jgi:sigma-B regulation protein RsbU (phosphoserine phosphatase)
MVLSRACKKLSKVKAPIAIARASGPYSKNTITLSPYIIKARRLAYALIGDFNTSGEMLNNDLNFIQTLMNVIMCGAGK